ncbi:hypothetical protein [Parageobacillus thermoglucosidasius]|uniref:hypothetical protein n=1 Tax=Parageobacillus thermoglucosidasius TaxID=1426 RepID=UPI0030C71245
MPQTGHGLKNVPASLLLFCVKNPYFVRAAKSTCVKLQICGKNGELCGKACMLPAKELATLHERGMLRMDRLKGTKLAAQNIAYVRTGKVLPSAMMQCLCVKRSFLYQLPGLLWRMCCLSQVTMSSGGFAFACAAIRR